MKKKGWLCGILSAVGFVFLSLGFAFIYANADEFEDARIEDVYPYGEEFTVPEIRYTSGGSSVVAEHKLILPDGSETSASVVELNKTGVYTLVYVAQTSDGKTEKKYSFRVDYPLAVTGSDLSSVSYEEYNGIKGLKCRVLCGDTVTFSQPIDISRLVKSDILFKFFLLPSKAGTADFSAMEIVLTDFYDESNYVRIVNTPYRTDPTLHSYTKAGCAGQPLAGWDTSAQGGPKAQINNIYGAVTGFSWIPAGNFELNSLSYSMDLKEKQVYANNLFVIDLDESAYYNKLWEGFSGNLVKLSVKPQEGATAEFFVTDVFGTDLSSGSLNDTEAPSLRVDTLGYGENVPDAVVGKPYKLFSAEAIDLFEGAVRTETRVYRNYYSSSKIKISTKNGTFTPDRAGNYYIEYTAKDSFGNTAAQVIAVESKMPEDVRAISIDVAGGDRTVPAGTRARLASFSASGGVGDIQITVYVADDKGTEKIAEGDSFVSWSSGVYTVKATGIDYVGNVAETSYTVNVNLNETPIFDGDVVVPEFMIVGNSYRLPALYADDYGAKDAARVKATVSVSGGAAQVSDDIFIPNEADAGQEISVVYTAKGANGQNVKEYKTTVVSVMTDGTMDMAKYFVYENASGSAGKSALTVNVKDGSRMRFVNPVLWQDFSFKFKPDKRDGRVEIVLTGYENKNEVLKFAFVKKDTRITVVLNDMYSYSTKYTAGKSSIDLTYEYLQQAFSSGGQTINVLAFADGKSFGGFSGEKVMLDISVSETTGKGTLDITSLNRQSFSADDGDYVAPQILLLGEYGGTQVIGCESKVVRAVASDVLSGGVTFTLSVRGPSGFVTSSNGVRLYDAEYAEYSFICDEYGTYEVIFSARDGAENLSTVSYVVNIVNRTPPTISLSGMFPSSVTAGKAFAVPKANVTDDVTATENIVTAMLLRGPDGTYISVRADTLVLAKKGGYTFTYMAMDADGNISFLDFEFTVN